MSILLGCFDFKFDRNLTMSVGVIRSEFEASYLLVLFEIYLVVWILVWGLGFVKALIRQGLYWEKFLEWQARASAGYCVSQFDESDFTVCPYYHPMGLVKGPLGSGWSQADLVLSLGQLLSFWMDSWFDVYWGCFCDSSVDRKTHTWRAWKWSRINTLSHRIIILGSVVSEII